jgi:phospholipid/cholesterol/gamma-HCH transport system substrate-binding protein
VSTRAIRRSVAAGVALLLAFGAWWQLRPRQHPHHYAVLLSNASELVTRNAVRLNDVQVGKVTSIGLSRLDAKVGFTVAKDVTLPAGTRVVLRQTSMLGEMFLDLVPAGGGRLRDGATIPLDRTRRAAELEEVVSLGSQLVNQVTADNFNRMVTTFDEAWGGHPERLTRLFDAVTGASASLNSNREALAATIDRVEQMAAALAPHTGELAGSIQRFADGMRAVAAHREDLSVFTEGLKHLSDSAADLLVRHEAQLTSSGRQTKDLLDQLVSNLGDFEKALQAMPDFNLGWQCTVQGNWIQELQAVYPETTRMDTGGGHCDPAAGPRGREEQGQVQVTGTPTFPTVDDPAGTGEVDLGAGSANGNSGHRPGHDGNLRAFMMTTTGG